MISDIWKYRAGTGKHDGLPLQRLLARVIMFGLLPLLALSLILGGLQLYLLKSSQEVAARDLLSAVSATIDHQLTAQIAALQVLAASPLLDKPADHKVFYNNVRQFSQHFGGDIVLADLSRQMLLNTREPFGSRLPKLPVPKGRSAVLTALESGAPAVGDTFTAPIARKKMLAMAVPVIRGNQTRYLLLSIVEQERFLPENLVMPKGWVLTLRDSRGESIAVRQSKKSDLSDSAAKPATVLTSQLKKSDWTLALEISGSSYYLPLLEAAMALAILILAASATSIVSARLAAARIARSVESLVQNPHSVHDGELISEIEAVRKKIMQAAAEQEEAALSLRDSEERYRSIFNNNHAVMLVINPQTGRIVNANPAAVKWYGWSHAELCSMNILQINTLSEDQVKKEMEGARTSNKGHFYFKHRLADGSVKDVEVFSGEVKAPGETLLYSIVHDITEQKQSEQELIAYRDRLEELVEWKTRDLADSQLALLNLVDDLNSSSEKLAALNRDLEAANRDLEAFSYSVSHDLRAPLRHLTGFAELLEKHQSDRLDEKSSHYLNVIVESATQMNRLIENLLSFSRIGRVEMSEMEIDMNLLVSEVQKVVCDGARERRIEWDVAELPLVRGDASLLWLVILNLLSNAVKFTRDRDPARIGIDCKQGKNGELIFSVSDNGSGFDMRYIEKLFNVFQRLHRQEEFEGTGIGLANVKRIIQRHAGRVWAEGEPGKGATFYFTLPGGDPA
jgi:PAS domain S-box-containing protein